MKKTIIMKKTILFLLAVAAIMLSGCRNDWRLNDDDLPQIAEKARGMGSAGTFTEADASLLFAVEVSDAGNYTLVVSGRAASDEPGTGSVGVNGSEARLLFPDRYKWSEQSVELRLEKGVNDIAIRRGQGNGLFFIDYILVK